MSDKLSSPSTASGTSNNALSPRSRASTGSGDDYFLVIRKQPPTYVYSNESFDVEVALEAPKSASPPISGSNEFPIIATLYDRSTGRPCGEETILITDPRDISIAAGNGTKSSSVKKVRCMIRRDLIRRDLGVAVELRFSHQRNSDTSSTIINSVATNPIHLVNYKIKLSMDEDWGKVWYKDEGGRDKSMELYASIYDKDGQLRTGEQIPLLPVLCYDTGDQPVRVSNQDILRTLGSSKKIVIDKDTGKAKIRFRVEDVSKNHQGQDFRLEVAPDPTSKIFKDVAVAFTPSINVRSKRNKRPRKESGPSRPQERRPSPTMVGRPRTSFDDDRTENAFEGFDIVRLREAIKGVLNWTDEVVNGLYPLQWQVLGYQQHPDGTPDYNRPYHNMPNPNPCISRILSMYSDSVRDNLRVLLDAVERAEASRSGESPYAHHPSMAPAAPREVEDPYAMMARSPPVMHPQAAVMPMAPMGGRAGMHPSIAQEAFRDKGPPGYSPSYQSAQPQMHPMNPPMNPYMRSHANMMGHDEGEMMHSHQSQSQHRRMHPPPIPGAHHVPMQRSTRHPAMPEEESREGEVEYVLAKQYKSLRTGGRLGFPAYSANKEILGFYKESSGKVGVGQFTPISRHSNDFGPLEIMQASEILEDAIAKKSEAVHCLKDWGSIANLLDHVVVYEWSKDIGNDPAPSRTG